MRKSAMLNIVKYKLPSGHSKTQFINELAARYAIREEPAIVENSALYDTFDWRLYNKSLELAVCGKQLYLRKLGKNDVIYSVEVPQLPVFLWDFPDGAFKKYLAPLIKMRALLKLVDLYARSTPYRILNPDEKTVARVVYEEIRSSRTRNAPVLMAYFCIKPVRGYAKYAQTLAKTFKTAGLTIEKEESLYFKALAAAGKKPGSYSAKVNIQLEPQMPSSEATRSILRFLVQIMQINRPYIEKDLDTEFLHDFRVAVRRTRSALSQIKSVFPEQTTHRFKTDFAYVGKLSNQLRDLDVYLLKEDNYKTMLPEVLRKDIDPLFEYLRKKRSQAFRKVVNGLKTKKYARILTDWERFLKDSQKNTATAANAEMPVIDLARTRIYKKYRNVVKTGKKIIKNTEDEMLHVLRIECKKLRYLMEFFASLFVSKKINLLIGQLKILQDNLGDFNDLCIQEDYLLNIAEELPVTRQQGNKPIVALGCLIGALDNKRQQVKGAFARTFRDFASPANQALFRELFTSNTQENFS
jgi:CHAD domain-containing protein